MCSWVRRWWKSSGKWEPFLASIVWNPWVPMKMAFFAWKAAWGSILIINQLKRRGQTMLNRCYMHKDDESIDHMLSSKASILWWLYFFFLFLVWLRWSTSIRGTLLSWHGSVGGKKWKKKLEGLSACFGLYERKKTRGLFKMLNSWTKQSKLLW